MFLDVYGDALRVQVTSLQTLVLPSSHPLFLLWVYSYS